MGCLWLPLGRLWAPFGSLWLPLGRPWAPFGRPLGSLWPSRARILKMLISVVGINETDSKHKLMCIYIGYMWDVLFQKSFTKWVQKRDIGARIPRFCVKFRCGSFPHSHVGWGPHKSIKNDETHTTVLVTMGKGSFLVMVCPRRAPADSRRA